ncbi:MAG: hypothetical protein JW820_05015 [Spirochaetales bacterium]|nr:hypothetical protein [Spirochaetales bacterium]
MQRTSRLIVYPEGDEQEIEHRLSINQLVDLNGFPLPLPLPTPKTIVYRVVKLTTEVRTGEDIVRYHLEQLWRDELEELVREQRGERS